MTETLPPDVVKLEAGTPQILRFLIQNFVSTDWLSLEAKNRFVSRGYLVRPNACRVEGEGGWLARRRGIRFSAQAKISRGKRYLM
jgi:hypothetical protein